jgi:3-hydroxyisobutyrate dehydrogenase-like beta-hydroxyacid dehydrogenase
MEIAVLGTGPMGSAIVRRLCEAGHTVHVWNRTRHKADRLAPFGALVYAQAHDAVRSAEFILCVLEDGKAVGEVLFSSGLDRTLRRDAIVIDMTSTQPAQARDHAARLSELGLVHLDAPMSGGAQGVEKGTLAIMVGGKAAAFERAQAVFKLFGHATHVGPNGTGQLAKLANQMIVGITIGAVAEALLMCEKGGASMAKVKEAMAGGFADSRVLQVHGQRMIDRDFSPHGSMAVQLKDLRNALGTAEEIGFDAPVTRLFEGLYSSGVADGLADLDHAGLFVAMASHNAMS